MVTSSSARPSRILYIVTEDWYFVSHRLPMACAAREAGFEVHVATNVANHASAITREGFILHPVKFVRGRLSPFGNLETIRTLRRLHREIMPALTHRVALQPIALDALASIGLQTTSVNAIAGLGHTFTSSTIKAKLLRGLIGVLFRFVIGREKGVVLVQNGDDRKLIAAAGVSPSRIELIPGSGVDIQKLNPSPDPPRPFAVAFVGRLIAIKGIRTLIEAHRILCRRNIDVSLLIAGAPDPANPSSVSPQEVDSWRRQSGISYLGHVADIATVWDRAHVAVLPSLGGEGLPKSLLEAAACGRPMIATDVSGCREIVIPGDTGILVPVDDPDALAAAIQKLAQSEELRVRLGGGARRLAVARFSSEAIGKAAVDLYRRLADKPN